MEAENHGFLNIHREKTGLPGALVLLVSPHIGHADGGFPNVKDGKTTTYYQTAPRCTTGSINAISLRMRHTAIFSLPQSPYSSRES